ncbi:DNA-3-methyladenine glycosylase I [Paralimibaculum aggregatum]|uniref:DNA-3-methyladenine glycosylase I n=1 Tax=Paralimibaculum aggregatum TaxID=3036245 RepID=A0ABQ6LRZ9_9RHOB|nr:DNA-3-methyladenine glycosylase I [Limibaculum sp. NKW23]GMG84818.1 DNA-3-methyladenine glycosylase I [Limibaculum sp. NKW23]
MSERCTWCGTDPLYVAYHDTEWGRPETGSRALWEKLVLDGFQAGLAWITILRKRENFRAAFEGFEPARIARWGEAEVARCLADPGIVRSRAKIEAAIGNARAYERIEAREGFARFLWGFTGGRMLDSSPLRMADVPAETPESRAMSKALKAEGFKFCGPVIVYAFMQASGLVNDHLAGCPARDACTAEARALGL